MRVKIITTLIQYFLAIFNLTVYNVYRHKGMTIKNKLLEFSHNPFKKSEHLRGIYRVSPVEHCKLRHDSTKVKLTEQKIKDCMMKGVLLSDYMYIKNHKCYTHYI